MHEENEREEYSGEMIVGENRSEENEDTPKRTPSEPLDLEAEVAQIFSEQAPMPIPVSGKLPKQRARREKREQALDQVSQETSKEEPKAKQERLPKKRGSARYVLAMILLLMASVVVCVFAVQTGMKYATEKANGTNGEASASPITGEEKIVFVHRYDDASGVLSVPEIYAKYSDGVVSIRTQTTMGSGVGSGFFVREDGYVATVAHVVEGAEQISVITKGGERYTASVVASNPMTDLALLKIEGSDFHALEFGASGDLLVGERVIAIGTPASLDYAGTLCTGEVSYGLRTVKVYDDAGQILQKKMSLLQTNAPVNSGNSGCPLFDEYGRVVGIVTMKLGGEYEGMSFAIPSDGAKAIFGAMMRGEALGDSLLSLVSVSAPRLGILGQASEVDGIAGVKIVRFSSNTCDAAIKLREGDLIVQVDRAPIATVEELTSLVQEKNPGDPVLVTVLRAGQRLSFEVVLEKS